MSIVGIFFILLVEFEIFAPTLLKEQGVRNGFNKRYVRNRQGKNKNS